LGDDILRRDWRRTGERRTRLWAADQSEDQRTDWFDRL